MTRWSAAHRIAQIAAHNARSAAGVAHDQRIDIIEVMKAAGVHVFGEHGTHLFGAMVPGLDGTPDAIWLNASSTVIGQRHSAGHEWGHRALEHTADCGILISNDDTSLDEPERGTTADRDSNDARSLPESTAEAFAAWMLMPRAALVAALRALRADSPPTPRQCYQAALLLGTSYRGTARHLATAHLAPRPVATALMKRSPKRIKADLDEPGAPPPDPRADIWRLTDFDLYPDIVLAHHDRVIASRRSDAADALLSAGLARMTHVEGETVVLTVLAPGEDEDGDHLNPERTTAAVVVPNEHTTQRFSVHRVVRGLADTSSILDLSQMTPEQINALAAEQEAYFARKGGIR